MENKRVKMTKKIIKSTLIDLLSENELSSISVSSLCQNAEINRSTFYAHYQDLRSVLEEMEQEFVSHVSFFRLGESFQKQKQKAIDYLSYIEKNEDVFQILYKNGYLVSPVIEKSILLMKKETEINSNSIPSHIHEIFIEYATPGTFQMISYWLKHKNQYTLEQVALWILELANSARSVEIKYKEKF